MEGFETIISSINKRLNALEDSDLAQVVGMMIDRIDLLEKQMEHLINHCNHATHTVQRHEMELTRIKERDADGKIFDKFTGIGNDGHT